MATEAESISRGTWGQAYKTERTKAMPKNTLFGSVLEKKNVEELQHIMQIDVEEYKKKETEKRSPRKRELPEKLKSKLPGPQVLEHTKDTLLKQREKTEKINNYLRSVEERAVYFNKNNEERARQFPLTKEQLDGRTNQWITSKDIQGANEINKVGLNEYYNYDYAKHSKKPPAHTYSLFGDVLRHGMDFPAADQEHKKPSQQQTQQQPHVLPKYVPHKHPSSSKHRLQVEYKGGMVDLPQNIKHMFGTKVCRDVLSSSIKVEKTLDKQDEVNKAGHRAYTPVAEKGIELVDNPVYRDLGNSLRCDFTPGYTFHKPTLVKDSYNPDVFKNRLKDPDEYRMKRDELGAWAEHDSLRKRLKKRWNNYVESLPKQEANWDRNATRVKPVQPQPKIKSKPKRTNAKYNSATKPPAHVFEEVVFKTPPLSPLPIKDNASAKLPAYTKDNAFWEFYDQNVP